MSDTNTNLLTSVAKFVLWVLCFMDFITTITSSGFRPDSHTFTLILIIIFNWFFETGK